MEVSDMAVSTENLGVILVQKGKNKDATFTPPFSNKQPVRFSWDVSTMFRAGGRRGTPASRIGCLGRSKR